MREALAIVAEQGLGAMWGHHTQMGKYLWAGLRELGLEPYVVEEEDRLITVNTIRVPKGIDGPTLIKFAMEKFSLEISAGEQVPTVLKANVTYMFVQERHGRSTFRDFASGLGTSDK